MARSADEDLNIACMYTLSLYALGSWCCLFMRDIFFALPLQVQLVGWAML